MSETLPPVDQALDTVARAIDAEIRTLSPPAILIGLETGGVTVRDALLPRLQAPVDTGSLDISFFRDDYSSRGLPDNPRASVLPMSVDGRVVILVDDVIHTGRSIRAAMNAIFELGRPRRVRLAVLVDRGGRDLPIAPDYCGCRVTLPDHRRIELVDEGGLHLRIRDTPA